MVYTCSNTNVAAKTIGSTAEQRTIARSTRTPSCATFLPPIVRTALIAQLTFAPAFAAIQPAAPAKPRVTAQTKAATSPTRLPVTRVLALQKRHRLLRALRPRHWRPVRYHRLHHRAAQRRPPIAHRDRPQRRTHLRRGLQLHHPARPAAPSFAARPQRRPHRGRLL